MIPDYKGTSAINEILTNYSQMKIMSMIEFRSRFWQIPLKQECGDYIK